MIGCNIYYMNNTTDGDVVVWRLMCSTVALQQRQTPGELSSQNSALSVSVALGVSTLYFRIKM